MWSKPELGLSGALSVPRLQFRVRVHSTVGPLCSGCAGPGGRCMPHVSAVVQERVGKTTRSKERVLETMFGARALRQGYRVAPWSHVRPYRILFAFHWRRVHWLSDQDRVAVEQALSQKLCPRQQEAPRFIAGITDDWEGMAHDERVSTSGARLFVQAEGPKLVLRDVCLGVLAALLEEVDLDRHGTFVKWGDGTRVPYGAPETANCLERLNRWDPRNAADVAGLQAAAPRAGPPRSPFFEVDLPIRRTPGFNDRFVDLEQETLAMWNKPPGMDVYKLCAPGPLLP